MSERVSILECEDPLGRVIRLESENWCLKISTGHPELMGHLDKVKATLTSPDAITADALYSDRECYYLRDAIRDRRRPYLKICVGFERHPKEGRVITAYLVSTIPAKEALLWHI